MGRLNVGGGINTSDATATAADIKAGKTAYVNKEKIVGTSEAIDINNGTNKTYKANSTITKGDFIELINSYNTVEDIKIAEATNGFSDNNGIFYLNDNKILCLNGRYGVVGIIDTFGNITFGTPTEIYAYVSRRWFQLEL